MIDNQALSPLLGLQSVHFAQGGWGWAIILSAFIPTTPHTPKKLLILQSSQMKYNEQNEDPYFR